MTCGIYKITNLINGQSYVGQSVAIERRWTSEKNVAYNSNDEGYNSILSKAFRKYGIENFSFEILEECKKEELNEKEKFYIAKFDTYKNGYNATMGGDGSLNYVCKISKEDLEKIYDLLINTKIPQKEIAKQFNVGEDVISTINNGKSRVQPGYAYPLRNNKKIHYYCCDCGVEVSYKAIRCAKCNKILQRTILNRPSRKELKSLIRNKSFVDIGKLYKVSDNSIRKWCVDYNLPSKKTDIKKISDEDWQLI